MKTSKTGLQDGHTRATFIVKEEKLKKIKKIAWWDRISLKKVIDHAFDLFISDHEKNNGSLGHMNKNETTNPLTKNV